VNISSYKFIRNKVIVRLKDRVCETYDEFFTSQMFYDVLEVCIKDLVHHKSPLLKIFGEQEISVEQIKVLANVLLLLSKMNIDHVSKVAQGSEDFLRHPETLNAFVEHLYNYWRNFDRFIVCDSVGDRLDRRAFRTFSGTIGKLTDMVRSAYRDIQENITGLSPRVYRQVRAGAEIATIALPVQLDLPAKYNEKLKDVSVIRQILLYPPLIINQPNNKRTGQFERINKNPLDLITVRPNEWLCYPAKVGSLLVLIYFHEDFYELGFSLCNLFEIANDDDLKRKPDAVYFYGVPDGGLDKLGVYPTVFYEDTDNGLITAGCPNRDEFGYFGYLKKMVLTLHNIKMMRQGAMPFHGALVKVSTNSSKESTILIMGDTGAGKSETLEALREIGNAHIREMIIIADDMGSVSIKDGKVLGYGTETGAFLRLDDLKPGYAYGQMDRAIIMNPSQTNARIILPVTTYAELSAGHKIDAVLYANNYEHVDDAHPIIEQFNAIEDAMNVFRQGAVMSKGTTTTTGLVHSYFANIFGPAQYQEMYELLAKKYFSQFFETGVFVGQMRTRLGIQGMEHTGPEAAAQELLRNIV
jgi:hypothetical protein